MPKKTFRSSNPTVLIKRNKFGGISKHKVVNKRPKLVVIDEKNENNWKYLKSELGYKTDSLFLEYLLNLAQRDLKLFRPKKRHIINDNEEALKSRDCNPGFNNEKQSESYALYKIKAQKSSGLLENEKKRGNCLKTNENDVTKIQNYNQIYRNEKPENTDDESNEDHHRFNSITENSSSSPGQIMGCASVKVHVGCVCPPEDKSLINMKTENAKDFYVDSITVNDRHKRENIDELSAFKDLTLCNSSDINSFNQLKKNVLITTISSHDSHNNLSVSVLEKDKSIKKEKSKDCSAHVDISKKKNEFKPFKKVKTDKNNSEAANPLLKFNEFENLQNGVETKDEIKPDVYNDKKHSSGKREKESTESSQNELIKESEEKCSENESGKSNRKSVEGYYGSVKQNDGRKNVYDFDDSEREVNIQGSSRWCHKLLKTKESGDDISLTKLTPFKRTSATNSEIKNVSKNKKYGIENEGETDSDSSDSGLKLKIDESFGGSLSFAEASIPDHLLLKLFDEEHGQTVFTKKSVMKSTLFGPLIGQNVREMDIPDDFDMKFIWEINSADGVTYISTKDIESSNWLRFLRPASSREMANLISSVKENKLYFISTKDINEGEELLYWMDDVHSAWSKKKLEKKNCGGCNIQFSHPLYYRKHCMIFHDPSCSLTIRKYHCKICGLAVLGKEKIMKHAAEMHQGKGAYQCQYCHKFFLRLNYLEMHRTYGCSKNPQRSRPLCDLCGRKFCQPQKLKVHIKRMHSDMAQVLKDFQCKSCLKILGSRAALQRHMKEVHNKDIIGACTCDRCGKMFQNKSNLKIHMLTHSGVKPFKCQQAECTAAFTTKQCLQFHYKKVHGFTDDFIPKIERSIAYTFDAYSGGTVSEPSRCQSPKLEGYHSPLSEERECCLDLSLVNSPENSKAKDKIHVENICQSGPTSATEELKSSNHKYITREEFYEKTPENGSIKGEEIDNKKYNQDSNVDGNRAYKMMLSKGSKKWMVSEGVNDKVEERFKPLFRPENTNASLLVEAAISAAEKDINDKPIEKLPVTNQENIIDAPPEVYSISQYAPVSPGIIYDSSEKKMDEYGKTGIESQKPDSFPDADGRKCFPGSEKNNFNDFLRCSSLLRINTSPVNEMPKDYNINSIIREQDTESFTDIEIQDYRNRDLLETYKENESFHEQYRAHELYRNEKLDLYRNGEPELRMSTVDKFEYRDFDISNETYRNLATNLEKYRNADLYRLRSEGYELMGYRDFNDERDVEAQNLCLKEKSFQYETLEELARIGRDNPGFECLLVGESGNSVGNQSFGATAPRLHGMLSPRSYHPSYESESVDLSVPRSSYSSSPIYTLDLTPARVELPTRHLDFRSHLGLSAHRFQNSRLPGLSNGGSQLSPTGYSVYSSPYVAPAARHSPTSQFQPYTSLYY